MTLDQKTGILFRVIRTTRSVKQKDVAEALGISSTYLSMMEHGNRDIPLVILEKFCKYFKLDPGWFVEMANTGKSDLNELCKK